MLLKEIRLLLFHSRWRPSLTLVFLLLWVLFIIYATTLPFDFSASADLVKSRLQRLAEHPLKGGRILTDVVSNVLLFIPFGFLLAMWRDGRGASLGDTLVLAVVSGAVLSGSVEVAQLFCAKPLPLVCRPHDQHVRLDRGGRDRLDLDATALADPVGPDQAVAGRASADGVCPGGSAGLVVGGLAPFDVVIKAADLKVAIKKSATNSVWTAVARERARITALVVGE